MPTSIVFAHSGRTDSSGGHYNHSTGEYHYHHGYPAHQHTGGACPYEQKEKEDESCSTLPFVILVIIGVIGGAYYLFKK